MSTARLPDPPKEYSQEYMERLLNQINLQFRAFDQVGPMRGTALALVLLPTSSAGLRSGDVWVDTAAGRVLKIVA
jgi:hypothetical protein